MQTDRELLTSAYKYFNARDLNSILNLMHPNVDWPNGMEGGRVYGHHALHDYWTRQWAILDPHVDPTGFASDADGRTIVQVRQVVRDLAGQVLIDQIVQHVYLVQDGLIHSMEIRDS